MLNIFRVSISKHTLYIISINTYMFLFKFVLFVLSFTVVYILNTIFFIYSSSLYFLKIFYFNYDVNAFSYLAKVNKDNAK